MINVSNSLKEACNGDKLTYREYVVLKGTTAQIDVKTEMYATAYKDTHFIGTFNMKYIKFTTSNDVQYRNKELTFYKEINGKSFKVGNFIVTEIKDNDSNEEVSVTAYDYGLKFAQPYETNLNYASGTITLKDVLDEICTKVGVSLTNETITNGDFIVDSNQFVNGEMYGDVVSSIAYLSGDFATINNDDKLELIFTKETDEIIEDYVDLEDKRDTQPITSLSIGTSQVEGQSAVIKDDGLIEQYGEHWLIINDVPFAYTLEKREQLKTAIFNKVKGFGYSSFKSEYSFKPYMSLGDLVQFKNKDGVLVNSIILRTTTKYDNVILEAPSVTSATITYEMPETSYDVAKRAEIIANQNTAEITAVANKIVITSNIKNGVGSLTLENAHEGYLEKLSISGNLNLVYPRSYDTHALYPSENLYPKDFKLQVDETIYDLDINYLNYMNASVFDEYICEKGESYIIRRVGIDEDGEMYELDEEIKEEQKTTAITVVNDSTITLLGFENAIMSATYLMENDYTSVFATQVDLKSEVKVSSDNINLNVEQKLQGVSDEEGNVTSASIILAVNKDGSITKINADKISLEGYTTINKGFTIDEEGSMTAISGKVAGWDIKNSGLTNGTVFINSDGSSTIYTVADLIIIRGYIMGTAGFTLPSAMIKHYDLNGDGVVNSLDYTLLQNLIGISMS